MIIFWNFYYLIRVNKVILSYFNFRCIGVILKYVVFFYGYLVVYLFIGFSFEGFFVFEFVMKIEETKVKGVRRMVEGYLYVRVMLSDV